MKNYQQFSAHDVEILGKETLYQGFFETNVYRLKHRKFEGGWTDVFSREVFERGHAAAVLLYDPNKAVFVLLEQFRFPAMETSKSPWLIEVVAGIIEEGESAEQVCIREAQEEAGLQVLDLLEGPNFLVSPGGTSERIYAYLGRVDATNAGGIHGLDNETEDIKVHLVSEHDARRWCVDNTIENATALVLLQWFFLHRDRIRQQWLGD